MRKVVIVTSYASKNLILKYAKTPLIGVEKGIELIAKCGLPIALGIGDFDSLDYATALEYLKPNQIVRLNPHKNISDTEEAVDYMQKLGFDRKVLLFSFRNLLGELHFL